MGGREREREKECVCVREIRITITTVRRASDLRMNVPFTFVISLLSISEESARASAASSKIKNWVQGLGLALTFECMFPARK